MRRLNVALLTLALVLGAYLRFSGLTTREMSADEGASWAAARAPTVAEVLRLQAHLNPGEFGLHDLALHVWMQVFGDGIVAMRSLSAAAGTFAIILVFFVSSELLQLSEDPPPSSSIRDNGQSAKGGIDDPIAAVAALFFAVNLVTIKYAQEARMYPLALALVLAQVYFFLCAARIGGLINYSFAAVFTALSITATLTASLALLPEGMWLIYLLMTRRSDRLGTVVRFAAALGVAFLLTAPAALNYYRARGGVPPANVYNWISRPQPWAPLSLFNKGTGTFAFPLMAALVVWAVIGRRPRFTNGVLFALFWMLAAPVLLLIISYVIRPVFVERYMLSCFVPFFILVAIGACSFDSAWARIGIVTLVIALVLGHVAEFNRRPHDAQWREATVAAANHVGSEGSIAVAPRYAANVVRYYLAHGSNSGALAVGYDSTAGVIIIADTGAGTPEAAQLARAYPHVLAHVRGLVVREH